jgi:hypothetical protein
VDRHEVAGPVRGWAQTDADLYAQVMKDAAGGIAAMREAREGELFQ